MTVEERRNEFLQAVRKNEQTISGLCREFGISRPTAYKWIERYEQGEGLSDQSRAPHHQHNRTTAEIETAILALRRENPAWGGKTIREVLARQGNEGLPCAKTCSNILARNGCVDPGESLKHRPFRRFVRECSNELWQTDFKGDFLLQDGSRCYPLTILDDMSRFSIRIEPKPDTKGVMTSFEAAFRKFGLPEAVLSDNGPQFAGYGGGYTQFERWLMDHGVLPIHGRVMHPQTQGKIERFHRTMNQELLRHTTIPNHLEASVIMEDWRNKYNSERPHSALGMKTPAEVYQPSERIYVDNTPRHEYGGNYPIRKVNNWGYLRFDHVGVYLSETMADTYLEIRSDLKDGVFSVCYRGFKIADVDAVAGTLLNRTIWRLNV
jgi:transposase InsO family protein